jgi:hypothetical protein
VLDRRAVHAAASIILSHLYAQATDACYIPRHNHGVMQDLSILRHVRRFPALRDAGLLWKIAIDRLDQQVADSVTADGIHIENSPGYQVLYTGLLTDAIDVIQRWEEQPSRVVTEGRDRLLSALPYLLQPNLTLPQFGDTRNGVVRGQLSGFLDRARTQAVGNEAVYEPLAWVLTQGASGMMPEQLDLVFADGGYAAFRSDWDQGDPESAVTGHFTCSRLSSAHYHQDETSFEIYGYGHELIVDTGNYSYDRSNPLVRYQYEAFAHNVLIVDDAPFVPSQPPGIVDYGVGPELSWVQGAHDNYAGLGVESLVRTFAYARPDSFVVVDHVRAPGTHSYAQYFHLHPSLSDVSVAGDHTVIARQPDGAGPAVVLAPATPPTRIDTFRGIQTDEMTQGWLFEGFQRAEPSTAVVFRHDSRSSADLALVIAVTAPEAELLVPSEVRYEEAEGEVRVAWVVGGAERSVSIPAPPGDVARREGGGP